MTKRENTKKRSLLTSSLDSVSKREGKNEKPKSRLANWHQEESKRQLSFEKEKIRREES